jgi:glutaredoxin
MDPLTYINSVIEVNPLVVFSKNNCVFCEKIMSYLTNELRIPQVQIRKHNLEDEFPDDFVEYAYTLFDLTSSRTFPQMFIKGKYFGGYKELVNMHQFKYKELEEVMRSAGVEIILTDF